MIIGLLLLVVISLALSLALVPLCRNAALRWNLVDRPDTTRKIHRHPIPRIGGVPVVLASLCSGLIVAALSAHNGFGPGFAFDIAKTLAPAAALIFFVGLADDIFELKPWHKLAGQVLAAVVVVLAGVQIRYLFGFDLPPWLGATATVVWLVGCANAVNLIDGLDGLASGIALLAAATTFVAAILNGNFELAIAVAPLAGALLGFLVFNFNPASIFLGDCGSLLLGFLLGCYGVLWSEKSATIVGMTGPLIALSIPLLDTGLAIARRFLRRQPIFGADRSHIHHRLLARGLTTPKVVFLLYTVAGFAGTLALFVDRVRRPWDAAIIVVFVCGAIFGISQLGYAEFDAVGRLIRNDIFRRTLNEQIAVENLENRLKAAATRQDCWTAIEAASKELGFHHIRMQIGGQAFKWHDGASPIRSWEVRLPISEDDWIELSHEFGPAGYSTAVIAFAETIRKVLVPRNVVLTPETAGVITYSLLGVGLK